MSQPCLFIIAGSNGAGKSALGKSLLPSNVQNLRIFDGDLIFAQKRDEAFKRLKSPKYARQEAFDFTDSEFNRLISTAIEQQNDFAYEGHFSSESPWEAIKTFKKAGYQTNMIFLGLDNLVLSELRVKKRVWKGGFQVSSAEIHQNYYGNLYFLNRNFHLLDRLTIFDTSYSYPTCLFELLNKQVIYKFLSIPLWFKQYLPNLDLL